MLGYWVGMHTATSQGPVKISVRRLVCIYNGSIGQYGLEVDHIIGREALF